MQFSSSENTVLEKQIDSITEAVQTNSEEINFVYEIPRCLEWIRQNDFKKVCLQFPDHLLSDSSEVALHLQDNLKHPVYIMGDTAYGSCCVDYVAAAHINGDAIIHYGPVCFSKTSDNIPCLYIYEKRSLDIYALKESVIKHFSDTMELTIVVDTPYIVHVDKIIDAFNELNCIICTFDQGNLEISNRTVIFIGNSLRKIANLNFSCKPKDLFYYYPKAAHGIQRYEDDLKVLKRRYFLIEKIKDSTVIGIVIGTVAVKNYLNVLERIKRLITLSKKKYYVISVGKPTVAKLANFTEIDVYVVITCAMNEIYDSRDFYKPIVTPFDIERALNPNASELHFAYDYNSYYSDSDLSREDLNQLNVFEQSDVSLLTGKVRSNDVIEANLEDNRVALKMDGTVSINSYGAGYLANRSWKGLEQNLGCDDPELASEGRHGLAQSYKNEK